MQCFVYKGNKYDDRYLFVLKEGDFASVPASLLALLGELNLVMSLDLDQRQQLAGAEIETVKAQLREKGFFLQMPRESYQEVT